jgi:cytochrome P450
MTATINPEDLSSPEVIADPYPAYKALRAASPVFYPRVPANKTNAQSEPTLAWAVMRHADIMHIVRDPETFSSRTPNAFKATAYFPLIHDDGSRHAQLRRTVNSSLSPARVAELSGGIGELVDELLNDIGSGPVEPSART